MPPDVNQNPEQIARDRIDGRLREAGWHVQDGNAIDFNAGLGIAVREYQTDVGPADYVLFADKQAIGVVEAKPDSWGARLTTVEEQSEGYANAKLKWLSNTEALPFLYESTGQVTRFTNGRDPNPRSREVFTFHRPETFKEWMRAPRSFRSGIAALPPLNPAGLRDCQTRAITRLEASLKADKPRALVQMATGSGKTFTATTQVYRLLKHADARRVLFLVDTRNLGEQAEQEFMAFIPNDDNRKFTELYNVQRLSSPHVAGDSQVVISTIQRMYAALKGEELAEGAEDETPAERKWHRKEPLPVVYNGTLPPEYFDVVIIDECHRSIYNVWRQVIEYFDAFLVGLTATPDNRTYGFFQKNVVSEYTHEEAVADKVNVGNEIYLIDTEVTQSGGTIKAEQLVERRERQTRARRWEVQEEREDYHASQLDRSVVNPDQIRTVIRAFHDNWREIFPGREELPKTLIFAKTDSHADDIIQTVRQEFGEGNDFCRKITNAAKNPKSSLSAFRNDYYPRIAVTVDMIATGTDVRPLECLLFMRDVKSRSYFEQMKGRGTRVLTPDDLQKVTPSARAKTHYVIVDTVGVTKSIKTGSQPLDTRPSIPFKDLATGLMMGDRSEETVSSLAGREEREKTGGKPPRPRRPADVDGEAIVLKSDDRGVPKQWLWLSLSSLGEVAGGLTKNQKRNALPLKAKYLRVANVYANRLKLDEVKEIGVTEEELRKTLLMDGDLLFVEGNGSVEQIGRVAVWNDSVPGMTHQNHLIRFRANGLLSPRFALYFMMSPIGRSRITAQASSTSGFHTLSISKVEGLQVPLCSPAEQAEIVRILDAHLDAADTLDKEIEANLARADALRQSILKKAFSGQLVPQDPADEAADILLKRIEAESPPRERRKTTRKRKASIT